ncbi:phage tail protein [Paenibacillus glycanilyticus]|uniref:phage tail protein n=1 Tax=Paenibacillus glycanilyticus TaxID=126569 RepID=UPI0019111AB9|nr:hypothetical protein [Paenibacillus glycanilyticus]
MAGKLTNLLVRAGADFSAMKKEMQKAQADVAEFKGKIGLAMKGVQAAFAAVAALGIGKVFFDATKQAMTFEASVGQINRQMGSSAKAFDDWAKSGAKAFGLGRSSAIQYGATFGNLISNFADGTDDVMRKTQALLKASGVIASATGRNMQDVTERIRSGLLGETDAIEDLGININQSMLTSTDAFRRFAGDKSWAQLNAKTQQSILYFAILEQASRKYGDTLQDNTTTRMLMFTETLKDVRLALGQAFLPILNVVLPVLTKLAQSLLNVMNVIAQFSAALFGKAVKTTTQQQTAAINNQAASVGGLGDAYKAAGKEAKKAAGGVASFDEFNQLPDTSQDDSGGDGGAGGDGAGGISAGGLDVSGITKGATTLEEASDRIKKAAANVKKFFSDLADDPNVKKLEDALKGLKDAFKNFGTAISDFMNSPAVQKLTKFVGEVLANKFLEARTNDAKMLTGILNGWSGTIEIMQGLLNFDFGKVKEGFEKAVQGMGQSISALADVIFPGVREKITNAYNTIKNIDWKAVGQTIRGDWELSMAIVSTVIGNIKETLSKKWEEISGEASDTWGVIKSVVSEKWNQIKAIKWSDLKTILATQWASIGTDIATGWATITAALSGFWNGILTDIGWNNIKTTLSVEWTMIQTEAATKWAEIKAAISDKWNDIKGLSFDDVRQAISKAWDDLKADTDAVFDALKIGIKADLNYVIDAINSMIDRINSIKINVPDWVTKVTGYTSFGFNFPHVPRLARGGIVDGKTNMGNYIAGEAGAEMVVPLENTSFTDKIASALGTAVLTAMQMGQNGQGGGQVIQMDGVTVARVLNKYLTNENARLGGSLINVT